MQIAQCRWLGGDHLYLVGRNDSDRGEITIIGSFKILGRAFERPQQLTGDRERQVF